MTALLTNAQNVLAFLPEWNPQNRATAALLQKWPEWRARQEEFRALNAALKAARPQLPLTLQKRVDAFGRTVNRLDVLHRLVEQDVRRGVRGAIRGGRLREEQVSHFPDGLRGEDQLGLGPLLVIAFAVALAIVIYVPFSLNKALIEISKIFSSAYQEAQLLKASADEINAYRKSQGMPPVAYVPGSLGSGSMMPLLLIAGGAVVLLVLLKKRRKKG